MRYTTSWSYVGDLNFATGDNLDAAVKSNGDIAVAFRDNDHDGRISVKKFAFGQWNYEGAPGFSDGDAQNISMVADSGNVLYVSYSDFSHNQKITVQKLQANTWSVMGEPSFSTSAAYQTNLSLNRYGELFITYINSVFAVAKKFMNGNWTPLGNLIVPTTCLHTSIVNDTLGNANVFVALQQFQFGSTYPFMYRYRPCNEADYNFVGTALVDSAITQAGGTTTLTVSASGGTAPYTGTGVFTVTAGLHQYTIIDRSGCSTTVDIFVDEPASPCIQNYWTGGSNDWDEPGNWTCGTVPTDISEVFIEEGYANYPIITTVVHCKQLAAALHTSVIIGPGGRINITGL